MNTKKLITRLYLNKNLLKSVNCHAIYSMISGKSNEALVLVIQFVTRNLQFGFLYEK